MKILVTGGSGLVGQALKHIHHNYPNDTFLFISSRDVNLLNEHDTIDFFMKEAPDYVIHLAANVGGLYKNMRNPVHLLEDNLKINSNVLKAAHQAKVIKLIACLSTCIFPNKVAYPITENDLHQGPPHTSNQAYAYAKRLLCIQCESYRQQYNDHFLCVIPTNIYGPFDNFHLDDSHVIPGLIHKCYRAKQMNEPFIVSGSGKPLRQFIYSLDLATCIMRILHEYHDHDPIIISVNESEEVSIYTIATIIARHFDYEHKIQFDSDQSDGQYKKTASNQKLMSLFPELTFTPITVGIQHTIDWFLTHYESARK